jgi:metal-responsive CopG/Arc/MetJ family transcriptional regulator
MAGKQISITLSPYILDELEKLASKRGLKKSAIITIAVEKYAKEEVKKEREEESRENDKK